MWLCNSFLLCLLLIASPFRFLYRFWMGFFLYLFKAAFVSKEQERGSWNHWYYWVLEAFLMVLNNWNWPVLM